MLKKMQGGGWHKKVGVHDDHVEAELHFIDVYGAYWQTYAVHS